jgi:hypothetical protein
VKVEIGIGRISDDPPRIVDPFRDRLDCPGDAHQIGDGDTQQMKAASSGYAGDKTLLTTAGRSKGASDATRVGDTASTRPVVFTVHAEQSDGSAATAQEAILASGAPGTRAVHIKIDAADDLTSTVDALRFDKHGIRDTDIDEGVVFGIIDEARKSEKSFWNAYPVTRPEL